MPLSKASSDTFLPHSPNFSPHLQPNKIGSPPHQKRSGGPLDDNVSHSLALYATSLSPPGRSRSLSASLRSQFGSSTVTSDDGAEPLDSGTGLWETDYHVFGVLHKPEAECDICDAFVSHIASARESKSPGFAEALQKLHARHDIFYHEGVEEGMRKAAVARRPTKDASVETQTVVDHMKQELDMLKEESKALAQVLLGKMKFNQFLQNFPTPASLSAKDMRRWTRHNVSVEDSEGATADNNIAAPSHHSWASDTEFSFASIAPPSSLDRSPTSSSSTRHASSPSSSIVIRSNQPTANVSRSARSRSIPWYQPGGLGVGTSIPNYYVSTPSDWPESARVVRGVRTALEAQIRAGGRGDEAAIALCKSLCTEAHATPPERKTYGMVYMLKNWRNPVGDAAAPTSNSFSSRRSTRPRERGTNTGIINPRSDEPPEVWYNYLCEYRTSWPRGIRVDPETGAPNFNDVRASRIFAQMRPVVPAQGVLRASYATSMYRLFTNHGRYAEIVQELGLEISENVSYRPFTAEDAVTYGGSLVDEVDVARQYASCGVTVRAVEEAVEDWAVSYGSPV